jgi:nitrogen regulatory protein PII
MKLVTIVCEAYALDPVKTLLREVGAHGFTHFAVEGAGAAGELLARLRKEFSPRYGMIAFESDVRVLRAEKFTDGRS